MNLTSIVIPDLVTSIGDYAFKNCSCLTSVTIPDTVTSIGGYAFDGTKWIENYSDDFVIVNGILIRYKGKEYDVIISDSVAHIGRGAFMGCSSVGSITIPGTVTRIGDEAFFDCSSLTSVTIPDTVTSIGELAFGRCQKLAIYAPENSYAIEYSKENNIPYK